MVGREGERRKGSGGGEVEGEEMDGRKEQIRYVGKEEEWDDCKRRGGRKEWIDRAIEVHV